MGIGEFASIFYVLADGSPTWFMIFLSGVFVFIAAAFTAFASWVAWFVRDKFSTLKNNENRVEKKLDKNYSKIKKAFGYIFKKIDSIDNRIVRIGNRVGRIEGKLGLGPTVNRSPLKLTPAGEKILNESGIKDAVNHYRDSLLVKIRVEAPATAYDAQECIRKLFQEFDFDEYTKRFKSYLFEHGEWGLYDILDVGAIYFRDEVFSELGFNHGELDSQPSTDASE